jgi:hypothetical protein
MSRSDVVGGEWNDEALIQNGSYHLVSWDTSGKIDRNYSTKRFVLCCLYSHRQWRWRQIDWWVSLTFLNILFSMSDEKRVQPHRKTLYDPHTGCIINIYPNVQVGLCGRKKYTAAYSLLLFISYPFNQSYDLTASASYLTKIGITIALIEANSQVLNCIFIRFGMSAYIHT